MKKIQTGLDSSFNKENWIDMIKKHTFIIDPTLKIETNRVSCSQAWRAFPLWSEKYGWEHTLLFSWAWNSTTTNTSPDYQQRNKHFIVIRIVFFRFGIGLKIKTRRTFSNTKAVLSIWNLRKTQYAIIVKNAPFLIIIELSNLTFSLLGLEQ